MKEISIEVEQLADQVENSIRVLTDRYIEWIYILNIYFETVQDTLILF
jgi:hypothetical protein